MDFEDQRNNEHKIVKEKYNITKSYQKVSYLYQLRDLAMTGFSKLEHRGSLIKQFGDYCQKDKHL